MYILKRIDSETYKNDDEKNEILAISRVSKSLDGDFLCKTFAIFGVDA